VQQSWCKAFKLLFLFSFLYEDFRKLTEDLLRGKPERDGVFLLGPNTNIKSKLINQLNKYIPIFDIYIVSNPENNIFAINTSTGAKFLNRS